MFVTSNKTSTYRMKLTMFGFMTDFVSSTLYDVVDAGLFASGGFFEPLQHSPGHPSASQHPGPHPTENPSSSSYAQNWSPMILEFLSDSGQF